jgi:hypothetical protein
MCPACLTTALLAIAGATSTGGLVTLAVKRLRTTADSRSAPNRTEGDSNGPTEDRVAS